MARPGIDKMYTADFQSKVVEYFTNNKTSIDKTGVVFGIKYGSVRAILLKHGLSLDDKKRYSEEKQLEIVNKYCSGYSTTRLRYEEKVDTGTIIKVLKKYHVVMRDYKPLKGRTWLSPEYHTKLVERMTGTNNLNWKGGTTSIVNKIRASTRMQVWRKQIFERDNYTCQLCGINIATTPQVKLEPHHIKFLDVIIKDNNIITSKNAADCAELWDLSNRQTLCKECHSELHVLFRMGL